MVAWYKDLLLLNAALLWSWLLLYTAWYVVLLEAGWNALFFEADWSNGLLELLCFFSGSFLLLVLSLALVGGGLVSMDVVLYGRYNYSVALVYVCCCLGCRWKCWLLNVPMALNRLGEALSPHGWASDFSDAALRHWSAGNNASIGHRCWLTPA
jgi:hypothetical protein